MSGVAFHDLPEDDFPFTIVGHREDHTVLFTIEVNGPGVVHIPGRQEHGYQGHVSVTIVVPPKEEAD